MRLILFFSNNINFFIDEDIISSILTRMFCSRQNTHISRGALSYCRTDAGISNKQSKFIILLYILYINKNIFILNYFSVHL